MNEKNIVLGLVVALILVLSLLTSTIPPNIPSATSTTHSTVHSIATDQTTHTSVNTVSSNATEIQVNTFNTYNELVEFVKSSIKPRQPLLPFARGDAVFALDVVPTPTPLLMLESSKSTVAPATVTVPTTTATLAKSPPEYSKTNVQVEGVDELDYVKTDGEYIYVARDNAVYIVKAYPPDIASLVSKIQVDGIVKGLFVENKRLIIVYFEKQAPPTITYTIVKENIVVPPPYKLAPKVVIEIYNVSTPESPVKIGEYSAYGSFVASRLSNNVVYVILQYPAILYKDFVPLPIVNNEVVPPSEIRYFCRDYSYVFTIILAIDVENARSNEEAFLTGSSARIYMSKKNLYILSIKYPDYREVYIKALDIILEDAPENVKETVNKIMELNVDEYLKYKLIAEVVSDYFNKLSSAKRKEIMENVFNELREFMREKTVIYRFSINGLEIKAEAKGEIPGKVLDQFSMDEFEDYFRVATTETIYEPYAPPKTVNNVYVLNMNLEIVGKLEGLALNERIYAARFSGTKCYLVTFRRVDPLFAIDLSNPREPKVLGFLKTPGFSEYLHPFGNRYLIGIGRAADKYGRIRGLKIALFDISDPENPREVSNITLEGLGLWSPILSDHKAFMINENKSYFAVPVRGRIEGIYIIGVSNGKLLIKGFISLKDPIRTIYIEDFIYGISLWKIKIVDDTTISEVKTISLA